MIRPLLALASGLLLAAAGFRHAGYLRQRCDRLQRWTQLLRHLALLMKEGAGTLPEIILMAARESALPDRIFQQLAHAMQARPFEYPRALADLSLLEPREQEILDRLLTRLGAGSRDSRLLALEGTIGQMEQLLSESLPQVQKECKMWRQLGLLGGACLALWLI